MYKRHTMAAMAALFVSALPFDARALGVGRLPESVAFGRPLDLEIPLRIEPGQPAPCVNAEVRIGDRLLAPAALLLSLGADGVLRIRSPQPVREPWVTVTLWLGCGTPASKRFTLLADPPGRQASAAREGPARAAVAGPAGTTPVAGPALGASNPVWMLPVAAGVAPPAAGPAGAPPAEPPSAAPERSAGEARAEADLHRQRAEELQAQLGRLRAREAMLPILAAALAAAAVLCVWLGFRLRELQRASEATQRALAAPRRDAGRKTSSLTAAGPAEEGARRAGPPPALSSVEALIDLEQQAEFFMLLGEHDAAVTLLAAQLDAQDALLPYLKLFEVHRRRQDHAAFEALRWRFQRRFGATAPAWEEAAVPARDLLDHSTVMARLQAAWPAPRQALAEIERLLLGGKGAERLGLQACRDAMMLYGVAREHAADEEREVATVDLLLPLRPTAEFAVTAPQPFAAQAPGEPAGAAGGTSTITIDLDLRDLAAPSQRGA